MAGHTSSSRSRRWQNLKRDVLLASYDSAMRELFPEDFTACRRRYTAADSTTPEKEARISLYQQQALERIPIRYIRNSILLVTRGTPGNP